MSECAHTSVAIHLLSKSSVRSLCSPSNRRLPLSLSFNSEGIHLKHAFTFKARAYALNFRICTKRSKSRLRDRANDNTTPMLSLRKICRTHAPWRVRHSRLIAFTSALASNTTIFSGRDQAPAATVLQALARKSCHGTSSKLAASSQSSLSQGASSASSHKSPRRSRPAAARADSRAEWAFFLKRLRSATRPTSFRSLRSQWLSAMAQPSSLASVSNTRGFQGSHQSEHITRSSPRIARNSLCTSGHILAGES